MKKNIDQFISFVNNNTGLFDNLPAYDDSMSHEAYNEYVKKYHQATNALSEHFGFQKAPQKISDANLDRLVASDSMVEITRGFGGSNGSMGFTGNAVGSDFMRGISGYGTYDEGGIGHFFAMENLSQKQVNQLGIEQAIDVSERGDYGFAKSMPYQATHYVDDTTQKNILRAGISTSEIKMTTNEELFNQIDLLKEKGTGPLADFRKGISESGNSKALAAFDKLFTPNYETASANAAILQGYDAAIVNQYGGNEIRVFNRSSIFSTPLKSTEEMDELYPRTPVKFRGTMSKGMYMESHADRRGFLESRLKKTQSVEFANGTMQYDLEGRSYFLHHSKTPDINVGEKIRTTQVGRQVTAGDAIAGHSYGWDARTGIRDAVANQVSNRGNVPKIGSGLIENLDDVSGPRDYSVYLTSANTADVYPDINVPGTAARAIKGEQEVLDRVSIPANLSDEEAENLVRQMMRKHGVFETTDKGVKSSIDNAVLATRGEEALGNFLEGHGEGVIRGHIKNINQQIASGGRRGIYTEGSALKHLGQLGNVVEQSGEEAAFSFAKASFTPQALGLDTSGLSAQITSKGAGTTQAMVDKAIKAQDLILSARSKSSIFGVARDASAAVAAGTKNSNMLRMVGAAKAVFKSRF